MEHEVVVPLSADVVLPALREPALLARCVPGLSTEADAGDGQEISGRLRVRIGSSTITYRGTLSLIQGREGVLTVLAEGQEARGNGAVTATVRIATEKAEPAEQAAQADTAGQPDTTEQPAGTDRAAIRFTCDLSATGRLAEFDAATLAAAGRRLLDRFATALVLEAGGAEPPTATVLYLEDHAASGFGDLDDDLSDLISFSDDPEPGPRQPAELPEFPAVPDSPADLPYVFQPMPAAADAALDGPVRRSIVGRSAEEVDHAPPRGRYAPAPPARSARARAATRWVGPETVPVSGGGSSVPWMIGGGVALIGGAVVLVRALRRR
ncbi:hypothetical protein [Kitasatospora sp. McL0602]|uniref:hypothetical protein n=1 Tax=Kitasatospora sp. McL0602 TaxID=3439530 RepID=UPI003F8AD514